MHKGLSSEFQNQSQRKRVGSPGHSARPPPQQAHRSVPATGFTDTLIFELSAQAELSTTVWMDLGVVHATHCENCQWNVELRVNLVDFWTL